jgi:hypothetical protein
MGTLKTCFVDGSPGSWPALADVAREIVAHWGKVFRSSFDQGQFGKARGLAKKVWGIWIDHVCGTWSDAVADFLNNARLDAAARSCFAHCGFPFFSPIIGAPAPGITGMSVKLFEP